VDLDAVQTNMVYIDVAGTGMTAAKVAERLAARGVLISPVGASKLRAVLHLDVDDEGVATAIDAFQAVLEG
jgi:threonine aldolase